MNVPGQMIMETNFWVQPSWIERTPGLDRVGRLVEITLKTSKQLANLLRFAEISHGIGNGVLVTQTQQGGEFLLGQLLHAAAHIVLQHEIEEQRSLISPQSRRKSSVRG